MPRKLFVTSALPYANGPLHIGHIMEYIQVDIWVRFQRMLGPEVHFVCADDAHGAPIMLEGAGRRGDAAGAGRAGSPPGAASTWTASRSSFDHWYTTDSPENTALAQDIYRRLKRAGLIDIKPVEQFYDPVKGMFLADRYIKGECPHCGTPRTSTRDACEVCGTVNAPDRSDQSLFDAVRRGAGAAHLGSLFFRLSDPRCRRRSSKLDRRARAPAAAGRQQGPRMARWHGEEALGDWDISRDAPYFGIPIPDRRASTSMSGWMRRSATWRR